MMIDALISDFKSRTRLSERIEDILCLIGTVGAIAVPIYVIATSYLRLLE